MWTFLFAWFERVGAILMARRRLGRVTRAIILIALGLLLSGTPYVLGVYSRWAGINVTDANWRDATNVMGIGLLLAVMGLVFLATSLIGNYKKAKQAEASKIVSGG